MTFRPVLVKILLAAHLAATSMACSTRGVAVAPASVGAAGQLHGVITDETGGVIPGASVTVVSPATNQTLHVTTDEHGAYRFVLPAGEYRVRAEVSGFRVHESGVRVPSGRTVEHPLTLSIGTMSEVVMVEAQLPVLSTSAAASLSMSAPAGAHYNSVRRNEFNTERYGHRSDNDFSDVATSPRSTFSIDVDRASYANVRRFLTQGTLPPVDAVRIEEMVNYFPYDYPPPADHHPFAAHVEIAPAPWKPEHRLVRIGLKAREISRDDRPPSQLVFLIDVSGSMQEPNKLPLVQQSLRLLTRQLDARDRVAMVVYAGAAGLVLPPTSGDDKGTILEAIDRLQAGGSTNGAEGIELAYDVATRHRIDGGVNRVILATDGDFNVGVTDEGSLVRLVQEKARAGVFLSVFGFGMGNLQDATLEALADKGDGVYAYIDTFAEARKALVEELTGTLVTVAKDVKIQVEFNRAHVRSYRLIGYENRLLNDEDFNDDTRDAGDIGAGHSVTALYEIVPAGARSPGRKSDPLVFTRQEPTAAAATGELMRLALRYKPAEGGRSRPMEIPIHDAGLTLEAASPDFKLAAAVAAFGMLLRGSPHAAQASTELVLGLAQQAIGPDRHGHRGELVRLVRNAEPWLAERRREARGARSE